MINESRLKNGTLQLGTAGAADMSCQVTNVRITSSYSDDGDSVETLCGDQKTPNRKLDGRQLAGTYIQDFDLEEDGGGIDDYLWNHDLEIVDFTFTPNDVSAPTISGQVQLEVPSDSYGGDVNTRLTADFAWNIQGQTTRTYGAAAAAAETATAQAAQQQPEPAPA